MSIDRMGKNNPISKECLIDGVEYESIADAMRHLNLTRNQIQYRLRSKNFDNYKYK